MRKSRSTPAVSRQVILDAAMTLASAGDYFLLRRDEIALVSGVSPALVSHYFGTMLQTRRSIMGEAIRTENLHVIACGLMHKDARAIALSDEIKRRALEVML